MAGYNGKVNKILALNGSPRKTGNTTFLLDSFLDGSAASGAINKKLRCEELSLKNCNGCLRCNLIGRCSIQNDDWEWLNKDILSSDVLVFATPVYFHHVTADMKTVIDRFRSFVKVLITETGLKHIPWQDWNKDFVLIVTMGSSDDADAKPIIDLVDFMTSILGSGNRMHVITATRLAVSQQVTRTQTDLEKLYPKLNLPPSLAAGDYAKNQKLLQDCYALGKQLGSNNQRG